MSDLQALLRQREDLNSRIAALQRESRSAAIASVKALMAEYGLTLADLGRLPGKSSPKSESRRSGPVPTKFRDPETGEAWTGRGLRPKWLQARLAAGRSIEEFAVERSAGAAPPVIRLPAIR